MSDHFYILSLRWTRGGETLCWWAPKNSGYTHVLEQAGKYPREDVETHAGYYNNGETTLALPCEAVDAEAQRVVMEHALQRLTKKRFVLRHMDDDGVPCEGCGYEPPPVCIGLKVIGDVP